MRFGDHLPLCKSVVHKVLNLAYLGDFLFVYNGKGLPHVINCYLFYSCVSFGNVRILYL